MNTKIAGLVMCLLLAGAGPEVKAQAEKVNSPSDTLVVLWSSGDPEVAEDACFMYAHNAKRQGWFEEVILVIWGPSQRVLVENENLRKRLEAMQEDGVIVEACVVCSKILGVTDGLKECKIDVKGMGVPLTNYMKRGYSLVCF
jgi:hypothetical protein